MAEGTTSPKFPKRYVLCLMAFGCLAAVNIVRSSLSIAIVPMVEHTAPHLKKNDSSSSSRGFDWDSRVQGYILSSLFYSQALVQIPSGFLSTKLGGKRIAGIGLGLCGFFSFLIPSGAHLGAIPLIILRILQGLTSGCCVPAIYTLWSKWAPEHDRSILVTFTVAGADTGNVITMIFGGIVATHWSWEWIFYLTGLLTILWTVLWFFVVYESPSTHPTITKEELIYIQSNIDRSAIRNDSIPWKAIFTSLPVWAIVAAHFGANWIIYLSLTELPTFLALALDYPVAQSGALASIPWVIIAVASCLGGLLADKLRESWSTVLVRKSIIATASTGTSLSMLLLTLLPADQRTWILISICLAMASCGLSAATFSVNHLDIGGRYGGLLMALSNCFASIAGILIPTLTGHIVLDDHSKAQWNVIFSISIGVCLFAAVFYVIFGAGKLQSWVEPGTNECQHVLNKSVSSSSSIDRLTDSLRADIKAQTSTEE